MSDSVEGSRPDTLFRSNIIMSDYLSAPVTVKLYVCVFFVVSVFIVACVRFCVCVWGFYLFGLCFCFYSFFSRSLGMASLFSDVCWRV